MDFPNLLKAIGALSPEKKEKVRQHLLELEVQEWDKALESAALAFRGDSTEKEMQDIFAAINTKSTPSKPNTMT